MKTHNPQSLKLFYPVIIVFAALVMTSCQQPAKFAQVKYTAAQINHWLDSSTTQNFIFQFYTPEVNDAKHPYQLVSYIIDSAQNYLNPLHPDTLAIAKDTSVNLTGKAVLGNTYISKKTIKAIISTNDGKMRVFDYLAFTPKILATNQHIVYEIRMIKGNVNIDYRDADTDYVDSNPSPPAKMK